ncbi:MAG: DUF2188 domain-containing protein [Sphaerochaetaceae bacterium]|nr:DUF2188 domain-containing protein [Sphaerochaetaceae bacterium]
MSDYYIFINTKRYWYLSKEEYEPILFYTHISSIVKYLQLFIFVRWTDKCQIKKTHHVVPNKEKGGWDVKKGEAKRASSHTTTKKEAKKIARDISKNQKSELYIHGKDGKIKKKILMEMILFHQEVNLRKSQLT